MSEAPADDRLDRARIRRVSAWLFAFLALFYLATTRGHLVGSDEVNIYQTTRSLFERGDLAVGFTRNVAMGPDGRYYSLYNAGLSLLALPFYALGSAVEVGLEAAGMRGWIRTFAGPPLGTEPFRFGGDIEIFFANLTNVVLCAWLGVLFFRTSLLLGARVRSAVAAALALGLATYVAPFATGLLRHPAEALFLLGAFHFALRDARSPGGSTRCLWMVGAMLGLLVQARIAAVLALPAVLGFVAYRYALLPGAGAPFAARARSLARTIAPIGVPLLASALLYGFINFVKFGSVLGYYGDEIGSRFETPLSTGLYAFLLSPGASIFLFSPLLLLMPALLRRYARAAPAECAAVVALALTYLLFYARFTDWHGLPTALGPRYLMAITPLLLLPLGGWLDAQSRTGLRWFALLVVVGFAIQFAHIAVSFGYVYHHEGYEAYQPPFGFMFSWRDAPLFAHFRALFESPALVDSWWVSIYRQDGVGRLAAVAAPIGLAWIAAGVGLARSIRSSTAETGNSPAV